MQVEIGFTAGYRVITGKGNLFLDCEEGTTLQDIFQKILKQYPGLKGLWLDKFGKPTQSVHVFLNGDELSPLSDSFDKELTDGDILEFIPPLSGG